jgi:hypothetical protein
MRRTSFLNFLSLLAGVVFAIASTTAMMTVFCNEIASAATVERVKGSAAIISYGEDETPPEKGDKVFATENGKRKAIMEVVQIKNGKAKVKITKGKAKEGMEVVSAKAKGNSDSDAANEESGGDSKRPRSAGAATLFKDMTVGFLGGYAMDSQSVTITGSAAQAMTGSGFSVRGFADIPVAGSLALLTRVGAEQFNVKKEDSKSEILYAVVDLMLKYSFASTGFVPFAMGGIGLHFPISKASNILDVNRISSTTVFYAGGGFNFVMGSSSYMQLTAEYGMFPPSNDVTTSLIAIRGGVGFRF